jgi:uncharacterized membrane protein
MQTAPPNFESSSNSVAGKSSTGLDANVAALLAYLFSWVSGLIFLVVEKENRFVRFHAMQSVLLGAAAMLCFFGLSVITSMMAFMSLTLATIFSLLGSLIGLAFFAITIVCMIKAYQSQQFRLPIIGDIAARNAK